jgi:fimbrial chaperone protein
MRTSTFGLVLSATCSLIMLCQTSVALADGLMIFPLKADLSPSARFASFNVTSRESIPTLMQLHVFAWTQINGIDHLAPSDDLLAGPPIFTLQPNQTQLIRVGLQDMPDSNQEVVYRLIIAEVPTVRAAGIDFAFRLSMPIFVNPMNPAGPRADWSATKVDDTHLRLTVHDSGDEHIRLTALRVVSVPDDAAIFSRKLFAYVLVGQQRSWIIPLRIVRGTRSLRVEATTDSGVLNQVISLTTP